MAVILGGITLPDVVIENELGDSMIDAKAEATLGGNILIWERVRYYKSFNLIGGSDDAWIDRTTLLALQALSFVADTTYSLVYESVTKTVRFRHEDQPIIIADPIYKRPNAASTDYYNNLIIKLMEVTA